MAEPIKATESAPGPTAKPPVPSSARLPVQKNNSGAPNQQMSPSQKPALDPGQKQLTPQQLQQLKEQQLKEQQLKQARARMGPAAFASTSPEILRKFAKYPPSLTFHIYETHYRFNNTQDSSIIPKESPMARSFLHHLIREEIPVEMTELLKDFAIRFYDGCLVVQVYDHRNMVTVPGPADPARKALGPAAISTTPTQSAAQNASDQSGQATPKDPASQAPAPPVSRPKTYRTLLRPTAQSLYYDLLYHTDSTLTKFTDLLSLQMESEILTLTNRKLDLSVPLNPYLQDDLLRPEIDSPKAVWDEKLGDYKVIHSHREPTKVEVRKLHQEQMTMQKSSEFEEMMFLLSSKYKHPSESTAEKKLVVVGPSTTAHASDAGSLESTPSLGASANSTSASEKTGRAGAPAAIPLATSVLGNGNATSNQFMRLRFIEEIRKRKESQKAQAGAAVAAHAQSVNPNAASGGGTSVNNANGAASGAFPNSALSNSANKIPNAAARTQQAHNPAQQLAQGSSQIPQNQFQQNPQFQKQQLQGTPQQQQAAAQQRQAALYAQQNAKGTQQQFSAASPLAQNGQMPQRQLPQEQGAAGMTTGLTADFASSPMSQNVRAAQGLARQNGLLQNNQKLASASGQQSSQQQQQLAKQADRIRAQQFQVQQARQQQQQQLRQQQPQTQQQAQPSAQPSPQNYSQLKQSQQAQLAQVQAAKRQKLAMGGNQISQQNQFPQSVGTPQMGNMQTVSNVNTPIMGNAAMNNNGIASSSPQVANQMTQISQSAQGQASFQQTQQNMMNNRPASQPAMGPATQGAGSKSTAQQQQQRQQQQQIFQMTLTPQEQHTFRQLQTRMNTLAQMSNTGVAPNGTQLTAQQQQQALQQAKHIQQQLLQRFPTYFQRLRQYQALQDERLLAIQRQHAQGQSSQSQPQAQPQSRLQNNMGMADGSIYGQQNAGMNTTSPAMQQQMMSSPMMSQMNNGIQPGQGKQQ